MKKGLFGSLKGVFDELLGKNRFKRLDFVLLKTTLRLAAVDGVVAEDEIGRFRELAAKCRGYSGESFDTLWDDALRSAGYLLLQSHFLDHESLVAEFVKESEGDFVGEVILETEEERARAFEFLNQMAMADGECSAIERDSIDALAKRVKELRDKAIAERYSRGAGFDA